MEEEKGSLLKEYKKSRKNYKRQLSFLKRGLPMRFVQTLRFAKLIKVEKK